MKHSVVPLLEDRPSSGCRWNPTVGPHGRGHWTCWQNAEGEGFRVGCVAVGVPITGVYLFFFPRHDTGDWQNLITSNYLHWDGFKARAAQCKLCQSHWLCLAIVSK